MELWKQYTDFLIPETLKISSVEYRKALVVAWLHTLSLIFIIFVSISSWFIVPDYNGSDLIGLPLLAVSYYIFHRYANMALSGNIMAGLWYLFFVPLIIPTGGIHSDNILWLIMCPVLGVWFANRTSGVVWFLMITVAVTGVYVWGKIHPEINTIKMSDDYYFISYLLIGFLVFGFILMIEQGQIFVVHSLDEKNQELTEQKRALSERTEELQNIEQRLRQSNQELQNFAYAASHDLKEPLRMIKMYTQLLQKKMKNQLEDSSGEYMFYITDGVARMQKLLDDLLSYSRLGRNVEDIKEVDLENVLLMVIYNLTVTMRETDASITATSLPTLQASTTDMTQLFQNLIANAIKFRRKDVNPAIQIAHLENPHEHLFSFSDNGIGIKAEHQDKVFNIFTRLHARNEYDGSGIGLATCKKIIDNFGGRIWLTSTEGVGTTFYFTIPKKQNEVFLEPHPIAEEIFT